MTSTTKTDHVSWLRSQLETYEKQLAQAAAEVEKLQPIVTSIQTTITALSNGVTKNGHGRATDHPSKSTPNPIGVRTLTRRPEFTTLSTIAAIKQVLGATAAPISCRKLTDLIFDVEVDKKAATKSMSSALAKGVKQGYLKRFADGSYTDSDH